MDFVRASMSIDVDGGFTCPFCGRHVDTLNILVPGVRGSWQELHFSYGCCDTADDAIWALPVDTVISKATLPTLIDTMLDMINNTGKGGV